MYIYIYIYIYIYAHIHNKEILKWKSEKAWKKGKDD